jgi:hypothetical protein
MGFQTECRAAAVELLTDYAEDDTGHTGEPNSKLQVYPARPRTIKPPTAFVDGISERLDYTGQLRQRLVTVDMIIIHGLFDSKEAADQRDIFVDGFADWVWVRIHSAGANTTVGVRETEDLPNYVPDWIAPAEQRTYYATRIAMEGYAGG